MFLSQLDRPARLRFVCNSTWVHCTLVFSVSTLHLLVDTLLHLALKDSGPTGFVVLGDFQDVGSVDPVVCSASHTVVALAIELVDRYLCMCQRLKRFGSAVGQLTLL